MNLIVSVLLVDENGFICTGYAGCQPVKDLSDRIDDVRSFAQRARATGLLDMIRTAGDDAK